MVDILPPEPRVRYPLAPNGVFWSIQGEGHLRGQQMVFVRLAGCSVGCPECDTDYSKATGALSPIHVADMAWEALPKDDRGRRPRDKWAWITGGEPADHDLGPLVAALRSRGFAVAVATSGHKRVIAPVDWLSVSPHHPDLLVQTYGNELKLVDGLNGLELEAFAAKVDEASTEFWLRYAQPLSVGGHECPASLRRCVEFVKKRPSWCLSRQDHHVWELP